MITIAVTIIFIAAAYGFGHWTQLFRYRRPGVPAVRLLVTGAWLDPDLYLPEGERHRRRAATGLGGAFALGLLLWFAAMAGLLPPPS